MMNDQTITGNIECVLHNYHARTELRAHPVVPAFEALAAQLADTPPLLSRPALLIRWSMGRFNRRARVPWLALLDRRETHSVRYGFYCDYLFRQDLSGLYLSFSQGVAALTETYGVGHARALLAADRERLQARYRGHFPMLRYEPIDLRTTSALGTSYQESSVAHYFYPAGAVPEQARLLDDLEQMLLLYDMHRQMA